MSSRDIRIMLYVQTDAYNNCIQCEPCAYLILSLSLYIHCILINLYLFIYEFVTFKQK